MTEEVKLGHWNYRLIRWDDELMIHEVFYDDQNNPMFFAQNGATIVGDDPEEIKRVLANMQSALNKPILTPADFPTGANIN